MPRKIVPFRNVSLFLWPKTFCVLRGWTIDGHFLRPTQCRFLRFEVPSMMQHWYEMPRRAVIRGSVSTFSPRYHCSLPITLVPMDPYELYWLLEEPAVCSACHGNHRKLLRPNILDWGKDFSWNSRSSVLIRLVPAIILRSVNYCGGGDQQEIRILLPLIIEHVESFEVPYRTHPTCQFLITLFTFLFQVTGSITRRFLPARAQQWPSLNRSPQIGLLL